VGQGVLCLKDACSQASWTSRITAKLSSYHHDRPITAVSGGVGPDNNISSSSDSSHNSRERSRIVIDLSKGGKAAGTLSLECRLAKCDLRNLSLVGHQSTFSRLIGST